MQQNFCLSAVNREINNLDFERACGFLFNRLPHAYAQLYQFAYG
jgi:hypothetical protein